MRDHSLQASAPLQGLAAVVPASPASLADKAPELVLLEKVARVVLGLERLELGEVGWAAHALCQHRVWSTKGPRM